MLDEVNDHNIDFLAMPESTLNNSNQFVRDRLTTVVDYQHPNAKICILLLFLKQKDNFCGNWVI